MLIFLHAIEVRHALVITCALNRHARIVQALKVLVGGDAIGVSSTLTLTCPMERCAGTADALEVLVAINAILIRLTPISALARKLHAVVLQALEVSSLTALRRRTA